MKIKEVKGAVIKDSAGEDAIEAEVIFKGGVKTSSSVGQGRSRGSQEKNQNKPSEAVQIIQNKIQPVILKQSVISQLELDIILNRFIQNQGVGINTVLAVSQAVAKAQAKIKKIPVWQYLVETFRLEKPLHLPCPLIVIVEGNKHNLQKNKPQIQEFLIGSDLETAGKVFNALEDFFQKEKVDIVKGLEGALAPNYSQDLKILDQFKKLKVGSDFKLGLDMAAESNPAVSSLIEKIIHQYPIDLIEDPFASLDISKWQEFCGNYCDRKIIIGDDLTVTDSALIKRAVQKKLINGVIIKPNQAGTVTKTFEAVKTAQENGLKIIVSHRAQETEDDILTDIAVAAGADYLKAGYPSQEERRAKWKRLKEINKNF